jgi:hypothetical protein
MKFLIPAIPGQARDLIATVQPNGGIIVRAEEDGPRGVPARRIAPATVAKHGIPEDCLMAIYRTGINRTYYAGVRAL